jgi:hypothetical protein
VRLDATERRDSCTSLFYECRKRLDNRASARQVQECRDRHSLKSRQSGSMLGREGSGDDQCVLALGRAVVGDTDLAKHSRAFCVSKGRDGNRARRAV